MRSGLEIFLTFTEVTEEKPLCGTFCPPSPQNNNNNNDDDNNNNNNNNCFNNLCSTFLKNFFRFKYCCASYI